MTTHRRAAGIATALLVVLSGVACSDDGEIDEDEIESPDLDPGPGEGLPGDSEDEEPSGDTEDNPDVPDLDPGPGDDLPGDSDDEGG